MQTRVPISYEAIRAEAEAERQRRREEEARAAQQLPPATPVNRPEPPPRQFRAATPDGKLVDPTTIQTAPATPAIALLDDELPRRQQYPLGPLPSQYTTDQAIRDAAIALEQRDPPGPQNLSHWSPTALAADPTTPAHWSMNKAPDRPYSNPMPVGERTPEHERFRLPGMNLGETVGAAYEGYLQGGIPGAGKEISRQGRLSMSEAIQNLAAGIEPSPLGEPIENWGAAWRGPKETDERAARERRGTTTPTPSTQSTPSTASPSPAPPPSATGLGLLNQVVGQVMDAPNRMIDYINQAAGQVKDAKREARFQQQKDIYAQLGVPTDGLTIDNFEEGGGGLTLMGTNDPVRIVGTPEGITAFKPDGGTEFYAPSNQGSATPPPAMMAQPTDPQQPLAPITIGAGSGLVSTPPLATLASQQSAPTGTQYRIRTNPDGTTTVLGPHTPNAPLAPGEAIADEGTLTRTGADWGPAVRNDEGSYRPAPDLLKLPPSVRKHLADQDANLQGILAPQNLADTINSDRGYQIRKVPRTESLTNDIDAMRTKIEHPERYAPVGTSRHPGPNGEPSEMQQYIERIGASLGSSERELAGINQSATALEEQRIRERGAAAAAASKATSTGAADNYQQTYEIAQSIAQSLGIDIDPTAIITPSGKGLYTINNDVLKMLVPTNNQNVNISRARLIQTINEDIRKRLDDPLIDIDPRERALLAQQYAENQSRIEALISGGGGSDAPVNEDDAAVDDFIKSKGVS